MPVTSGSGNPPWTRDETLVALDLLYRFGTLDRTRPEIIELSELLRRTSPIPTHKRKPSFRNADGVALKLQNLRSAIDPKRGLSYSKTDKSVVAEFPETDKNELHKIALAIRAAMKSDGDHEPLDDDEVFVEGEYLTARHRRRDRALRRGLLKKHQNQQLVCEICGFEPQPHIDRILQEAFFEAHHRIPLALAEGTTKTKVSDLALLCAGCHRFIHKLIAKKRNWIDIPEAKAALKSH